MIFNLKSELVILTATIAPVMGFIAAWEWWKSSKVELDLGYIYPGASPEATYIRHGIEMLRLFEPVDQEYKRMNEIDATWDAMSRASKINMVAALWTAGSVGFGALCTILGAVL
jgi:hypothetical protein